MNADELRKLKLNLNARALELDERQYESIVYTLENELLTNLDRAEQDYIELTLQKLKEEHSLYEEYKHFPRSDYRRARRKEFCGIISDTSAELIKLGCLNRNNKYVYTLDLTRDLALALSLTYDESVNIVRTNIKNLTNSKEVSETYLTNLILSETSYVAPLENLNFEDIFKLSTNMFSYFHSIVCQARNNNNAPLLSIIDNGYFASLEIADSDTELTTAISLKMWKVLDYLALWILHDITEKLNTESKQYFIASKFLGGFTIYTNEELPTEYHLDLTSVTTNGTVNFINRVFNHYDLRFNVIEK